MKEHPDAEKATATNPRLIRTIRERMAEVDQRNVQLSRILDQALETVRLFGRLESLMERRHRRIEQIIRETEALSISTDLQIRAHTEAATPPTDQNANEPNVENKNEPEAKDE